MLMWGGAPKELERACANGHLQTQRGDPGDFPMAKVRDDHGRCFTTFIEKLRPIWVSQCYCFMSTERFKFRMQEGKLIYSEPKK